MSHQGLTGNKKLLQSLFESLEVHDNLKCCMRIIQIVNVYVFARIFYAGINSRGPRITSEIWGI